MQRFENRALSGTSGCASALTCRRVAKEGQYGAGVPATKDKRKPDFRKFIK